MLLPYLVLGATVLLITIRLGKEPLMDELVPGIWIGRLLFPFEQHHLKTTEVTAVLNLSWEFPSLSCLGRESTLALAHVPILDGTPPSKAQFENAAQHVTIWRKEERRVLIHCAQGHGRTAIIAAAVLLEIGLASSCDEALKLVKLARPGARPAARQCDALRQYASFHRERC